MQSLRISFVLIGLWARSLQSCDTDPLSGSPVDPSEHAHWRGSLSLTGGGYFGNCLLIQSRITIGGSSSPRNSLNMKRGRLIAVLLFKGDYDWLNRLRKI